MIGMKRWKTIALAICMGNVLAGCRDEPYVVTCSDGPVNYRMLNDDLNPGASLKEPSSSDTITVRVIQTADELFNHVHVGFLRTKIDFEKETVLVGMVRTHSLAMVSAQQVESKCASNEIVLRATVKVGGVPSHDRVHVLAIVPKISDQTRVRFLPDVISQ